MRSEHAQFVQPGAKLFDVRPFFWHMEMDRARTRSLSATAVLAALFAVLALGALAGPVSAAAPQGIAAEEAVEAAEDGEEQAEDASTLAAFNAPTAHLTLLEAKLFAVYTRHIEYLRGLIAHIRESKRGRPDPPPHDDPLACTCGFRTSPAHVLNVLDEIKSGRC
jgi:hypothetical protein